MNEPIKLLSQAELAAIRERAAAATPGPWYDIAHPVYPGARHRVDNQIVHWANFSEICYASADNAAFIAYSREDVDRLLFIVERYREALQAMIDKVPYTYDLGEMRCPYCRMPKFKSKKRYDHSDDCPVAIAKGQLPEDW